MEILDKKEEKYETIFLYDIKSYVYVWCMMWCVWERGREKETEKKSNFYIYNKKYRF